MVKSKVNSNYTLPYRRKREGRTNYKKRLAYLKSGLTRLVVRPTSKNIVVQLVNYAPDGDQVLFTVTSATLKKYGWKFHGGNTPSAYLSGFLLAKLAKGKATDQVIVDLGLFHAAPKTRVFAAIKGAIDGGIQILADDEHLPSDDRVKGAHIESYAQSVAKGTLQFSLTVKEGAKPQAFISEFDAVKKKIMGA